MITEVERAIVSTHSRPKAAVRITLPLCTPKSFNTQPPEGGWFRVRFTSDTVDFVSTHSRLKAAGGLAWIKPPSALRFQHTAA